jgi:hypothetical protein
VPRQLEEVLDYLLPPARAGSVRDAAPRPASLPILTIPIALDDLLLAAITYNLGVALARSGLRVSILVPSERAGAAAWPDALPQPLGLELIASGVRDLEALGRSALDIAIAGVADARDGGIVIACAPPEMLFDAERPVRALLRSLLLLAAPSGPSLRVCYAIAKRAAALAPDLSVGLTLHGVQSLAQAERAWDRIARVALETLGLRLRSFGVLAHDLEIYRAVAAGRPIALEKPQAPASRALSEVAELIRSDLVEGGLA